MTEPVQSELFHESLEDALTHVINALGGHKAVASMLWPEKSPDEGGRLLRHCLDSNRAEKLSLDQLLLLLQKGHGIGVHTAIDFVCRSCSYQTPQPITPEDQENELMRQFNESVKLQAQIVRDLQSLNSTRMRAVK